MSGLRAVNLCLSNRCGARCIFCPRTRGKGSEPLDMPIALACDVVERAAKLGCHTFNVGENGDAFQNPDFLNILRAIKRVIPSARTLLYTNGHGLTAAMSKAILNGNLVQEITVNVDGIETYYAVKGLPYAPVALNLSAFLAIRGAKHLPLIIKLIPGGRYKAAMEKLFDAKIPELHDMPDDTEAVFAEWRPRIDSKQDAMGVIWPFGWAHRNLCSGDQARFACPLLDRVANEAFIAPNGNWYACCYCDQQNLCIGNVREYPLADIANGDVRHSLIAALKTRHYEAIGFPCTTVQACQSVELKEGQ